MKTVSFSWLIERQEARSLWVTYELEVRASIIDQEVTDLLATVVQHRIYASTPTDEEGFAKKYEVGAELHLDMLTPKEQQSVLGIALSGRG